MKQIALFSLALLAGAPLPALADVPAPDPYTVCAFYPQAAPCEALYIKSLKETAPPAVAVRQAWSGYARYLKNATSELTDQDRQFLTANGIQVPLDLGATDLGGLHNVIADPELKDAVAKRNAVNNFISRAIEAQLYCGLGSCEALTGKHEGA